MELRAIRRNRKGANEHLMQAGKHAFVNELLLSARTQEKQQSLVVISDAYPGVCF